MNRGTILFIGAAFLAGLLVGSTVLRTIVATVGAKRVNADPRQVVMTTQGEQAQYSLPYWGASMTLPGNLVPGEIPPENPDVYLFVHSPIGILEVTRWDSGSYDATQVAEHVASSAGEARRFDPPTKLKLPAAIDALALNGIVTISNTERRVKIRTIVSKRSIWILFAYYPVGLADSYEPQWEQAFNTFRFAD